MFGTEKLRVKEIMNPYAKLLRRSVNESLAYKSLFYGEAHLYVVFPEDDVVLFKYYVNSVMFKDLEKVFNSNALTHSGCYMRVSGFSELRKATWLKKGRSTGVKPIQTETDFFSLDMA